MGEVDCNRKFQPYDILVQAAYVRHAWWWTEAKVALFFTYSFLLPRFFSGQKFCWPNFFSKFFFGPQFVNPHFFIVKFFLGILDLQSGTLDLGFRIWGLRSVTWNSGFGIEDLGLRIWDLDSS